MSSDIPLVWLCGPPGVGKTALAWAIYTRLSEARTKPAYVDVDQLGMCYPEPLDDPDRHRLKARNVRALRQSFAAAGASRLIVSGVVDPDRGPETELIGGPIAVGRLRVDGYELRARVRARRGSFVDPDAAAREARLLDTSTFADWCLDTTALSIDEAANRVLDTVGELRRPADSNPRGHHRFAPGAVSEQRGGEVLWLTGPIGVGKSTVGFGVYLDVLNGGVRAAFVDVGQLCFFGGQRNHPLRAWNLAMVWKNLRSAGAEVLIATGPIDEAADMNLYEQALPNATFTWCRLHAGPAELTRRVLSRRDGGSWPEPGDPLRGQPFERVIDIAEQAIAQAASIDANDIGLRVDVDGLSAEEAVAAVLEQTSWPTRHPADEHG